MNSLDSRSRTKCPHCLRQGGWTAQPNASQHQKTHRKSSQVNLPYENYVGAVLGQKYRIAELSSDQESLVIYAVTNFNGESFEAQAFALRELPEKLYLSRKRRVKRLRQSTNFRDEIKQGESRYLVSQPSAPGTGSHCHPKGKGKDISKRKMNSLSESHFPRLNPPADTVVSRASSRLGSDSAHLTYAEAAAQSLVTSRAVSKDQWASSIGGFPISRKGLRQKERRQRRREERRLKAAF